MDQSGSSHHRQLTNGQDTWSARCGESRTPGAASGSGKRIGRKANTAPRPDSTGRFYKSALYPLLQRINTYLVRWLRKKFKRLKPFKKAKAAWQRVTRQYPKAFAGAFALQLGVVAMSYTVFVDASGQIVDRHIGELTAERLRTALSHVGVTTDPGG